MYSLTNRLLWGSRALLVALSLFLASPVIWAANPLIGQEQNIINQTNAIRAGYDLAPLTVDSRLMQSAQNKALDMARFEYFSHVSLNGEKMAFWINGADYVYTLAGENLAKGFDSVDRLMQAWAASSTHYQNLVEPKFENIGVGIAEGMLDGKETVFIVQHFGVQIQETAVSSATVFPAATEKININDESIEPNASDINRVSSGVNWGNLPTGILPVAMASDTGLTAVTTTLPLTVTSTAAYWMVAGILVLVVLELLAYVLWILIGQKLIVHFKSGPISRQKARLLKFMNHVKDKLKLGLKI